MLRRLAITLSLFATSAAWGQANAPTPAAPPPPACASPEYSQFDFWVGYWDVYPTGKDKVVAHSLIEKLYGGCAIRENWRPGSPAGGGSLNIYDPDSKTWRQVWTDGGNSWGVFEGGIVNGEMILAGPWDRVNGPGTKDYTRTIWTPNPDGSVRQRGEIRNADGKSWRPDPTFDFTYKRSSAPPPK